MTWEGEIVPTEMTEAERIQQLSDDLDKLVEVYRREYEICYASVVGVLNFKAFTLMQEAQSRKDELQQEEE